MIIPYQQLPAETLRNVLEEYISREGTDYGEQEYSLDEKCSQLMKQLHLGEAHVSYDTDSQTCSLVSSRG